jgi:hypothetical protein
MKGVFAQTRLHLLGGSSRISFPMGVEPALRPLLQRYFEAYRLRQLRATLRRPPAVPTLLTPIARSGFALFAAQPTLKSGEAGALVQQTERLSTVSILSPFPTLSGASVGHSQRTRLITFLNRGERQPVQPCRLDSRRAALRTKLYQRRRRERAIYHLQPLSALPRTALKKKA